MSGESVSSHLDGDASDSINPYKSSVFASVVDDRRAPSEPERHADDAQRQYRVRMEWSVRRRFLRLALPLRVGAIAGALTMAYGLYGFATLLYDAWLEGLIRGWGDVPWALQFLFTPIRSALVLWMCWLYWNFADAIVATAGGATSSMEEWSRIQHRLVWSMIAALIIGVLSIGWDWLMPRLLLPMALAN